MEEVNLFIGANKEHLYATSVLANNLSLNAASFGKREEARRLFFESKKYRRMHEKQFLNPKDKYYKDKGKNHPERLKLARKWLRKDWWSHWFWNYGFGIINILVSAFLLIILFTFSFLFFSDDFLSAFVRSLVSFTTLGFFYGSSTTVWINLLMGIESMLGAVYIALLASIFFTRAKRSF